MERELDEKTTEIASELDRLGRKIEQGDESNLLVWVIAGKLACAHRPLRHNNLYAPGRDLPIEATQLVSDWTWLMHDSYGIKSIICLMHDKDLRHYRYLNLGANNLVEFYRQRGFCVSHIPWEDPLHSRTPRPKYEKKKREVRTTALKAYDVLPKPVLLHCSAGEQRSAPVAAYIWWNRGR